MGIVLDCYLKETRALITELYLLVIYRLTKNNMLVRFYYLDMLFRSQFFK
jgi:hypothetical protein